DEGRGAILNGDIGRHRVRSYDTYDIALPTPVIKELENTMGEKTVIDKRPVVPLEFGPIRDTSGFIIRSHLSQTHEGRSGRTGRFDRSHATWNLLNVNTRISQSCHSRAC